MTNSDARSLEIKLDFLGEGKYTMVAFEDTPESDIDAEKVVRTSKEVVKGDAVKIKMVSGGGFAAYLVPNK
jgi:alpha-glucosidase